MDDIFGIVERHPLAYKDEEFLERPEAPGKSGIWPRRYRGKPL